ncbi:MAG: hypothetical protein KDK78_07270 [Chlamydiia bacterium]|nr:hypothetical protein [Chlamydiia bacterium]
MSVNIENPVRCAEASVLQISETNQQSTREGIKMLTRLFERAQLARSNPIPPLKNSLKVHFQHEVDQVMHARLNAAKRTHDWKEDSCLNIADIIDLSPVVGALLDSGDYATAEQWRVCSEPGEFHSGPTRAMRRGLALSGDLRFLERLERDGVGGSEIPLLCEALAQKGDWDSLRGLIPWAENVSKNSVHISEIYPSVVQTLARHGRKDEALALARSLKAKGHPKKNTGAGDPLERVYKGEIEGLIAKGQLEDAKSVQILAMNLFGNDVDYFFYGLEEQWAKAGDLGMAWATYGIVSRLCRDDFKFATSLVEAGFKTEAEQLYFRQRAAEVPDEVVCRLAALGELDLAERVVRHNDPLWSGYEIAAIRTAKVAQEILGGRYEESENLAIQWNEDERGAEYGNYIFNRALSRSITELSAQGAVDVAMSLLLRYSDREEEFLECLEVHGRDVLIELASNIFKWGMKAER